MSAQRSADRSPITAVGAVYDLIWQLELPPFQADEPLDPLVVRGVLMALASYLNHQQLRAGRYQVFPSDELLGRQIGRSAKQVGRVLDYLERVGLLVLVRQGLRPGRGRNGRPPIYNLPIDVWQCAPRREIKQAPNGSDTGVLTIAVQTPVSNGSDTGVQDGHGSDTGVSETPMDRTPVSTEPGHPVNPATTLLNPAIYPGHALAREGEKPTDSNEDVDEHANGHQVALDGFAAIGVVSPGSVLPMDEDRATPGPSASADTDSRQCPDCGGRVASDGRGHVRAPYRCRAFGRGANVERCPSCAEWIDDLAPSRWHSGRCALLRRGFADPSQWAVWQAERDELRSASVVV